MNRFIAVISFMVSVLAFVSLPAAQENWQPDWQAVSDPAELNRTWQQAVVRLPVEAGDSRGYFLRDEDSLNRAIEQKLQGAKLPLVIYLHDCEGLGWHREDVANVSRIGFAVIALNSFARNHPPRGCYEDFEQYLQYYELAAAYQKAELGYALKRIRDLPWVDNQQIYLIGSGVGGMVVAQHQGNEFAGHVIEGWGCAHPQETYNGIKSQSQIPIYSVISQIDRWYKDVQGFSNDCPRLLKNRPDSVSVVLDVPAHYVSWYPGSRTPLIKFLTRDFNLDEEALNALTDDTPIILDASDTVIHLKMKWSVQGTYDYATEYCSRSGKKSYLIDNTIRRTYEFLCY